MIPGRDARPGDRRIAMGRNAGRHPGRVTEAGVRARLSRHACAGDEVRDQGEYKMWEPPSTITCSSTRAFRYASACEDHGEPLAAGTWRLKKIERVHGFRCMATPRS